MSVNLFKLAVRGPSPIIIGLAGPSKSGKTYSALRLATGMAGGRPIAFINTEGARGYQYADKFGYQIADLKPPYRPIRYRELITAALEQVKPAVLIVDNMSHEHEGEGGLLAWHEEEMTRLAGPDAKYERREAMNFAAWIKPKADDAQLCALLDRTDCYVILCFRGQEKIKPPKKGAKAPDGSKAAVIDLGWQPIASKRVNYIVDAMLVLPDGCKGSPDMDAQGSQVREPYDKLITGKQIDEQLGIRLAEWAAGKKSEEVAHAPVGAAATMGTAGSASSSSDPPMGWESMLKSADSLATLQDVWKEAYKAHKGNVPTELEAAKNARKEELMREPA